MSLKSDIQNALPPFRNEKVLIHQRQGTKDIINEIGNTHTEYEADYDKIYEFFDTGNIYDTSQNIWNFLKYNLVYNAESKEEQTVKSPAAILHKGEKIDCKHYSLFAGGVLDAIKRNTGDKWEWCYRFASYEKGNKNFAHVFVVVTDGNKEIWIDPVLSNFNYKKEPVYFEDREPMSLYKISGIEDNTDIEVTVDKQAAENAFFVMVNLNLFGIKTLLNSNFMILHGSVKRYFAANGFDFNHLLLLLKS